MRVTAVVECSPPKAFSMPGPVPTAVTIPVICGNNPERAWRITSFEASALKYASLICGAYLSAIASASTRLSFSGAVSGFGFGSTASAHAEAQMKNNAMVFTMCAGWGNEVAGGTVQGSLPDFSDAGK